MTDPINDGANYSSVPTSGPASSNPAAYSTGGAPATGSKTLSLISMISGIVGVLLAITGWGGILLGLAAVILGHLGQRRERVAGKPFWLTGLITGYLALVIGILLLILAAVALSVLQNNPEFSTPDL